MASDFWADLEEALEAREPFVLATVVDVVGSSPGKRGQKMLVFDDGSITGTVGGGVNEERVRQKAMQFFPSGGCELMTFNLANPADGKEPICGGEMKVFLELLGQRPRLIVFGAGHIGRLLTKMASLANFRVTLVDERPEFASPNAVPEAAEVICCSYVESISRAAIDASSSLVIVTPGHSHDYEVLRAVLTSPARYVGMIGSRRKVELMKQKLIDEGADPARVRQVFSPVGLNLGGSIPEEIVVGILAQIVAFRNGVLLPFESRSKKE